jgi:hypothetical protein
MKHITDTCGCCEGIEILTPLPVVNRPGLTQLLYRIGSHATFLETMLARLSNLCIGSEDECKEGKGRYPLQALKTREGSDPSIALLDAWATVADVLTFYQERIANEGYLRTATEYRSVLELARLVGYQPRPGVASSVFLAYTLEDKFKDAVIIPRGAKSQSVPGPGELPQSFETSEDLKARAKWNNLQPRMTRPQTRVSIEAGDGKNQRIYLKGITTNLKPNDPLLIFFNEDCTDWVFYRAKEVTSVAAKDRTIVLLEYVVGSQLKQGQPEYVGSQLKQVQPKGVGNESRELFDPVEAIKKLTMPPSDQVPNSLLLSQGVQDQFGAKGETGYKALSALARLPQGTVAAAFTNAMSHEPEKITVYALRSKAHFFGHNYPGLPFFSRYQSGDSLEISFTAHMPVPIKYFWPEELTRHNVDNSISLEKIVLEPHNEQLEKDSWVVIERPVFASPCTLNNNAPTKHIVCMVSEINEVTLNGGLPEMLKTIERSKFVTFSTNDGSEVQSGFSSKVDLVTLDSAWFSDDFGDKVKTLGWMRLLTDTVAYTQSERLELAEEPIEAKICQQKSVEQKPIELDGFYEGLEPGRWVIVSGERSDIEGASGVKSEELAMISLVTHDTGNIPGDTYHTSIKLATKLNYCFKREAVTIYGNVVKATHGETRKEILGSGDGAKALQSFTLKQPPLTHVSASNPSGVDSTLKVYVNDVQWHETDSLAGFSATDRNFITKTDDEGKTTVIFGNGREGARLPTGIENIRAEYRNGIGKPGNVKAGQITLLTTRPLGVKDVLNPLRASGGADKESRDQARKNAPLAVQALDRLVSVQDYEDFARTYGGIGKAYATEVSDGRRQVVHVTIAGADDIPIDKNSDLYLNLRQALLDFGDPYQAVKLEIRELMLIVISARVRILPDYQWESVEPKVRATLLDAFSFERRELGQDVVLSEVVSIIQSVQGVAYVDVDVLRGIPEKIPADGENPGERRLLTPDEITARVTEPLIDESENTIQEPISRIRVNLAAFEEGIIRPAQLAFLTPEVPTTLILNQIT